MTFLAAISGETLVYHKPRERQSRPKCPSLRTHRLRSGSLRGNSRARTTYPSSPSLARVAATLHVIELIEFAACAEGSLRAEHSTCHVETGRDAREPSAGAKSSPRPPSAPTQPTYQTKSDASLGSTCSGDPCPDSCLHALAKYRRGFAHGSRRPEGCRRTAQQHQSRRKATLLGAGGAIRGTGLLQ